MAPSHAWTREEGSNRGGRFPSRGRSASRGRGRRVWTRVEADESFRGEHQAGKTSSLGKRSVLDPGAPEFVPKRSRPERKSDVEDRLKRSLREAERLKEALEKKKRLLEQEKEKKMKEEAARAEARRVLEEEDRRKRAQKLSAGFASAVKAAEEYHATRKAQETAMEEEERLAREAILHEEESVSRVLTAGNDHEVLDVEIGASREEIRAAYRKLAREIHPDKSTARRAKDAFQRLTKAYQHLSEVG